jgi:hypothetical protein
MHTCCYHSQEDKLPKKQNSIEYFQVKCCILLKPFSSPTVKYPKVSQAACSHKSFELTGALTSPACLDPSLFYTKLFHKYQVAETETVVLIAKLR